MIKNKKLLKDKQHAVEKDLLQEEFGHELGDYNAAKTIELLEQAKEKDKEKPNKARD